MIYDMKIRYVYLWLLACWRTSSECRDIIVLVVDSGGSSNSSSGARCINAAHCSCYSCHRLRTTPSDV